MVIISLKILTNCILLLNCITRVDPGFEMVERQEEDTAVTSLPLLDQHVILLNSLPRNVWLLPLGILAVSLRFYGPITDLLQLLYGLLKSIFNSMTGIAIMDLSNQKFYRIVYCFNWKLTCLNDLIYFRYTECSNCSNHQHHISNIKLTLWPVPTIIS